MTVHITTAALQRALLLARRYVEMCPWEPLPGPQQMAYESTADIIGYGGAAGGGKTDLACGKTITQHRKAMILRRVGTELTGIEDRLEEIIGSKQGYNGQKKIWRTKRPDGKPLQIEFASLPNLGDERGYQGRPHDLLVFDEAANFLEAQVRFLMGWVRTVIPGQRCQVLMCFNPPTSEDGLWVIPFFAPWLDPKHPNPAKDGEIRWFAAVAGEDVEVDDNRPFVIGEDGKTRIYDFDPKDYRGEHQVKVITPKSRTFIKSRVTDNKYLMGTNYMNTLQMLPEPLRSQMLYGDFLAGLKDDIWQVIPTAWVELAQSRWEEKHRKDPMDSLGVDVARGGDDKTVISRRHGWWFDELLVHPGKSTPDGPSTAALAIAANRDHAPIHIDVIGVGSSPYDFLRNANQQVIGVNVSERSLATDQSGLLTFMNLRSERWWKMRELLDPANNHGVALPPDPKLKAELCMPKWRLAGRQIQVEGREDIFKRLGVSPDRASAVILAAIETPKLALFESGALTGGRRRDYDPYSQGR